MRHPLRLPRLPRSARPRRARNAIAAPWIAAPWIVAFLAVGALTAPGAFAQEVQADVQIGQQLPNSPQPTTYSWSGEVQTVSDPGGYFYHYYYTGIVQPDARVLADDRIRRIPVRMNEWEKNRRWIVAKLTNYFQVSNNLPPTALQDYENEIRALEVPAEETPLPLLTPEPQPGQPGPGDFTAGDSDNVIAGVGQFGAGLIGQFNPRSAAEWTFYYDQLVLWKYYCARVLLSDQQGAIVEPEPMSDAPDATGARGGGGGGGRGGNAFGNSLDTGLSVPPSQIFAGGDEDSLGAGPVGGGGFAGGGAPGAMTVREIYDPRAEYNDPRYNLKYRDIFLDKAQQQEQVLYDSFIGMINEIEQRDVNREKYAQWLAERQTQVFEFAENWRKLREGESVIIDDTLFLITAEKLESPPLDAINLSRTDRLTPQDLINEDGTIKKPLIQ